LRPVDAFGRALSRPSPAGILPRLLRFLERDQPGHAASRSIASMVLLGDVAADQ